MGPPLAILNHTKMEYIRFYSGSCHGDGLAILIPYLMKLFDTDEWSKTDNITYEDIHVFDETGNDASDIETGVEISEYPGDWTRILLIRI